MHLPRRGCEPVYFGFKDLPNPASTPHVWLLETWHNLTWFNNVNDPEWPKIAEVFEITEAAVLAGTEGIAYIRIAGPNAVVDEPENTVVLPLGQHFVEVDLADGFVRPVRLTDTIDVW